MQVIDKDLGSFKVHLIKTDLFKTITMKVMFHTPIIKEDITKRNILSDILLTSSRKYATRRDLNIKSEELYAADIYTSNQRIGNYITTSFILQTLNDKYTEDGNFASSVEFLHEIIFNPDLIDNKFKDEKLELVKSNAKIALESIKENSENYSIIRLKEEYDNKSSVSYRMTGYLDDLEKINTQNLYDYYEKMIENDYVDIFVIGNINIKELLLIIKKYFKFRKVKKRKKSYELDYHLPRKKVKTIKEVTSNNQAKLAIALSISKLKDFDKKYSLLILNIILGGTADSKLFKEVREKNSLCYTIRSSYCRLDNLMIISAGIDNINYDKVLDLINKILDDIKKGKFNESDISVAKEYYNTLTESIVESPARLINESFSEKILGVDSLEKRKENINKITKKDIIRVSKKLNIDTIFLLEGGD